MMNKDNQTSKAIYFYITVAVEGRWVVKLIYIK